MKRTPLKRKTPLRSRAVMPKAKRSERTAHIGRMKRTATSKSALEDKHLARVAGLPCCVTGRRPVVVHHLMKAPGKRCRRDHKWVVPLINDLHRNESKESVHGLGTEAKFEAHHHLVPGFLIAEAERLWRETNASELES